MTGSVPDAIATRNTKLAILTSALIAIALFAPSLGGGFLSDDYLLGAFLEQDRDAVDVAWARVLADFARPWLGLESSFYRPMLSVSLASDLALGGGAPLWFHATNLALHAAVAAMTALLCALYCPARAPLAALFGGAFVAVHPIAVEPVCWIAARNSGLEVFFRMTALCSFSLWLRLGRPGFGWAAAALAACALASKESAVLLPVSMVGLDLLDRPARPWAERLRIHARFVPLWIGYFALRLSLFGSLVGDGGGDADAGPADAAAMLANTAHKLGVLLAPHGSDLGVGWAAVAGFVATAAILGVRTRGSRALCGLAAVWLWAHTLPTYRLELHDNLDGSRMLYGALPVLAALLAAIALRAPSGRWTTACRAAAVVALVALTATSWQQQRRYRLAWQEMREAVSAIAEVGADATPERPLAIAAMPVNQTGIPPCNPNAWYPLAERPIQQSDIPMVTLGFATVEVPRSESLFHDASPLRAVWHAGATIATWSGEQRRFLLRRRPAGAVELPGLEAAGGGGRFAFATPVPADHLEAVEIHFDRPTTHGMLSWDDGARLPPELAELGQAAFGDPEDTPRARFFVDLSHGFGLVAFATVGQPLTALTVAPASDAVPTALTAHARLPELAVPSRLQGAAVALGDLGDRLPRPSPPAPPLRTRLIVLGPQTAIPVDLRADGTLEPAALQAVADDLRVFRAFARQERVWFYWETLAPPGSWGAARSWLDWFELRD